MSDEEIKKDAEEIAEEVETAIIEAAETTTEVEAQIIAIKAEEAVQRAENAAATLEMAATIQVANIAQQAEQQVAEHVETVEKIEGSLEWAHEKINYLENSMSQLWSKLDQWESHLQTPQLLTDNQVPQTVEIVEQPNAGEGDQVEQKNLATEIIEVAEQAEQKVKRKIRAL